jgi:hypothetical protein
MHEGASYFGQVGGYEDMSELKLYGVATLFFAGVLGVIVWLGVRSENAKIDGCREAGGSMVGEICIIRNDCNRIE